MAMIEKGVDPSLFHEESKRKSVSSLKPALFLIGIGFGFLFGYLLDDWGVVSEEASFISMIILFGGLGLLLYYFIEGKKLQEDNRSE
jgi:predicted MFS family arabinose efflux permease